MEVVRILEYFADGRVRIDQRRHDGGTITINVDADKIRLVEVA